MLRPSSRVTRPRRAAAANLKKPSHPVGRRPAFVAAIPRALPTESNGSYKENGSGTNLLDEIDEVAPGQSKDLTLNLDEAKYVLICNMVHPNPDRTAIVHYARGMRTFFRVD